MSESGESNIVNQKPPVESPSDSQAQLTRVVVGTEWQGPLPPPDALALYDQIVPGGADRLLSMAERGHQHHIDQERDQMELEKASLQSVNTAIANDASRGKWGLASGILIALAGLGIGGWLTSIDKGGFGLVFLFVPLGSLVGTFIYSTLARRSSVRVQIEDRPYD